MTAYNRIAELIGEELKLAQVVGKIEGHPVYGLKVNEVCGITVLPTVAYYRGKGTECISMNLFVNDAWVAKVRVDYTDSDKVILNKFNKLVAKANH